MPRKLPWGKSSSSTTTPRKLRLEPPAKRQRTLPPERTISHNAVATELEEDEEHNADLSKPIYMRPSDDRYIMVEDEFLSIAQTYTRSIHRAEYERLQLLAKAKNATRISEIQRPVDGVTRMSKEMLLKHELTAKERARQDILRGLPGVKKRGDIDYSDSDDVEHKAAQSVWGKSSLGLLMCSPKKRERNLLARWKINPNTRAAAGFKAAEVDRDAARRRLFAAKPVEVGKKVKTGERNSSLPDKPARIKEPPIKHETASTETEDEDDDDDDDLDAPVIRQMFRAPPPISSARSASFPSSIPSSFYPKPPPPYRRPTAPASTAPAPPPQLLSATSSLASSPPPLPVIKKEIPPDFDFDFGFVSLQRTAPLYRGRSMAARNQYRCQSQCQNSIHSSPSASQGRQRPKLLDTLFPVKN